MCGIAGIVSFGGRPAEVGLLVRMADAQAHRGPDGEGFALLDLDPTACRFAGRGEMEAATARAGLAHRRLSIIDLSDRARQPMASPDGAVWIAYNGECYNYLELREELRSEGRAFRTESDTEVLLAAYERWGCNAFDRLNGMWGVAVWDGRRRRLVLCRDRFGVKPLYYAQGPACLAFASEIKALLQLPWLSHEANETAVADYLVHSRTDTGPDTFFRGVRQVEPGHYLEADLDAASPSPRSVRWWRIEEHLEPPPGSDEARAARFRDIFESAVRLRLRSDVPLGTCLSGGLDSTAVVCAARPWLSAGNQKTFSACYDGFEKDESAFVDHVVERTGVESHKTQPTAEGLLADLDRLVFHQEMPFGSTSIYAQWKVFDLVRRAGVTVTLDGQGADELLAGYPYFFPVRLAGLLGGGRLAAWWREAKAYSRLRREPLLRTLLSTAAGFVSHRRMIRLAAALVPGRSVAWVTPRVRRLAREITPPSPAAVGDRLNRRLYEVFSHDGLPALLRYADRNAMAHSVEARMPFMDYRLVGYLFSLPAEDKIRDGQTKHVLRRGLASLLPRRILDRHDKIGFLTPEEQWFRGPLRWIFEDVIGSASLARRGYCDPARLRALRAAHSAGRVNASMPLWRAVNLELWFRRFVDAAG